jgi:hypothetical protein
MAKKKNTGSKEDKSFPAGAEISHSGNHLNRPSEM